MTSPGPRDPENDRKRMYSKSEFYHEFLQIVKEAEAEFMAVQADNTFKNPFFHCRFHCFSSEVLFSLLSFVVSLSPWKLGQL